MSGVFNDPVRLLILVAVAVLAMWAGKQLAKQINRPDYIFV